jgi:hypothetical protein
MTDLIIACIDKKEYVASTVLFSQHSLRDHMLHQRSLFSLLGILTYANDVVDTNLATCPNSVEGRWALQKVLTLGGTHSTDFYVYVTQHFTEISQRVLCSETARAALSLRDLPTDFRRFVWQYMNPQVSDYRQLDVSSLVRICDEAKVCSPEFWTLLRPWLLRRDLADDARRYLGGRPGRIASELAKKQRTRQHRGIRIRDKNESDEV